jgi:hypothetical protein
MNSMEQRNHEQIERLERLLSDLRRDHSTSRETEAIRELGLQVAIGIREVGAMLTNVGWKHSYGPDGVSGA